MSNFDHFSEMMDHMGGDEDVDLPEVDGADDVSMCAPFLLTCNRLIDSVLPSRVQPPLSLVYPRLVSLGGGRISRQGFSV